MVVKGIIQGINNNIYSVYCPYLSSFNISSTIDATVCYQPGLKSVYKIGDSVYISFDSNDLSKPVILGQQRKENDTINVSCVSESLNSASSISLPKNTSIGAVSSKDILNIENLDLNVNDEIIKYNKYSDSIKDIANSNSKEIKRISNGINISNRDLNCIDNENTLLKNIIGDKFELSGNSLYGRINSLNLLNTNLDNLLGDISKSKYFKDFESISDIYNDIYSKYSEMLSQVDQTSASGKNSGISSMLSRAEQMINVEWTPNKSFKSWNSSAEYKAGVKYRGIPYTLFGYKYSFKDWKASAASNYSMSANCSGYGNKTGPAYGSCCADFVSEVLGLPTIIRNCSGLKNQPKYLETLSGDSRKLANLKPGDVLIKTNGAHVVWVGDVTGSSITIYEQTPSVDSNGVPHGARKTTYSKSSMVDSNGFFKGYTNVYRPKDILLDSNGSTGVSQTLNARKQTVLIGDSNTCVWASNDSQASKCTVIAQYGAAFYNFNSLSNYFGTKQNMQYTIDNLRGVDFDTVFIMIGTNGAGWNKEAYVSSYKNLLNALHKKNSNANLYIATILPSSLNAAGTSMFNQVKEWVQVEKEIYNSMKSSIGRLGLIDVFSHFLSSSGVGINPKWNGPDSLHINVAGAHEMSKFIFGSNGG